MLYHSCKIWIQAARPKTLAAAVAPILIGTSMAAAAGHFNVITLAVILFAAVMIQIGTNFTNDYYDTIKGVDAADTLDPTRAIQTGQVTLPEMKKAFIIAFALALAAGGYLVFKGGLPIILIGIASVVCGFLYTAGPVPLGYIGLGDILVLVFFGPVAVGGTYYLQTNTISVPVILAGLSPGLLSTALLTVNNIRDYAIDKAAGKKSLVVRFGTGFGLLEYDLCIIIGCFMPVILFLLTRDHIWGNLAVLSFIYAWGPLKTIHTRPDADTMNQLLDKAGQLLIIYSVLFSIGWLL